MNLEAYGESNVKIRDVASQQNFRSKKEVDALVRWLVTRGSTRHCTSYMRLV